MRIVIGLLTLLLIPWVATQTSIPRSAPATRSIPVLRHLSASLPPADANAILLGATDVLQRQHGNADAACPIELRLAGSAVGTFAFPENVVSPTSYWDLCRRPAGRVHLVNSISYCGGECPDCLGCSVYGGACIVVVRTEGAREGVLWAHEYGHNAGLDDTDDAGRVMNRVVAAGNKDLTAAECQAFLNPQTPSTTTQQVRPAMSIDDFVRQRFIHGVSYEEVRQYSPAVIERLLQLLSDPPVDVQLSNVVLALGMIGDERAFPALRDFIGRREPLMTRDMVVAKRSAVVALGYLVFNTRDTRALTYLANGVEPASWNERAPWRFEGDTSEQHGKLLTIMAIQALGLTGTAAAEKTLRDVRGDRELTGVVEEALRKNSLVQIAGVAAFARQQ